MSYPPPPPSVQPAPAGKPRLRGRIPLRLALIFGVVGIALAVVGGVIGIKAGLSKVNDFQRVNLAQGTGTLTFKPGGYIAYYEAPGFDTSGNKVPLVDVAMQNKSTGTEVSGRLYGNNGNGKVNRLTYDYNGHHGAAMYEFTIKSAGKYLVQVDKGQSGAASDADVAFGKSIAKNLAVGAIVLIVGVILIVAALILLIVGLVKRSRHKKELANAGAYGYPPPPGYAPPQAYGQGYQGYPPPPQQGWQQQPPPPTNP